MSRLLVVEDDAKLRRLLTLTLQAQGHDVTSVSTGTEALSALTRELPDLVVLDVGLPDMDGTQVIERLRVWSPLPVLVLSARDAEADKISALDAGADDYVTKPFGVGELLARVRAALRRIGAAEGLPVVATASFSVDLASKRVLGEDGSEVRLTPTEWAVLEVLAGRAGMLVTKQELLERVWGPGYRTETHYLRVYMGQLRRKLECDPAHPRHLMTEPGRGYRLVLGA
jgi:two-component system KDP operon response regulator KdpE